MTPKQNKTKQMERKKYIRIWSLWKIGLLMERGCDRPYRVRRRVSDHDDDNNNDGVTHTQTRGTRSISYAHTQSARVLPY